MVSRDFFSRRSFETFVIGVIIKYASGDVNHFSGFPQVFTAFIMMCSAIYTIYVKAMYAGCCITLCITLCVTQQILE